MGSGTGTTVAEWPEYTSGRPNVECDRRAGAVLAAGSGARVLRAGQWNGSASPTLEYSHTLRSHMDKTIRRFAMFGALLVLGACSGRQVEVVTNPTPESSEAQVSLRVVSSLDQPVNVYVVMGGNEMFVRQVGANATESTVVRGVPAGSVVTLRARPVDGRQVYERADVRLDAGVFEWRVP